MNFLGDFFNYKNRSTVCGLSDELIILYYYKYFLDNDRNVLIVTNNLYDSNKIFSKLKTYTDDVCLFPMDDFLASVAIAVSPDLKVKRLETLEHLRNNKKSIIVTNLMGYLRYLPSKKVSNEFKFKLSKNDLINRDKLIEVLDRFGYKRTTLVTSTGEYAIRGFIVDIFPIESDNPIRLEFFGDEIDSIRFFNDQTQLSINEVSSYTVLPFNEIETESSDSLFDYMDNPFVFFVDYNQIMNGYKKLCNDIVDYNESKGIVDGHKSMFEIDDIKVNDYIKLETINNILGAENYNSKPVIKFKGDYEKFKYYCLDNKNSNKVVICLSNDKQIDRISSLFDEVNVGSILDGRINIIKQRINEGFIFHNYIFISEYDIDDAKAINNYKNSYKIGRKIKDFNDLKVGDYVVHSVHGIGIYGGIVPIKKGEMIRDYIKIDYLGNDKVYIPVEKITTIYKYADNDAPAPKINKLNSTTWAKTKMKVRSRIKDISEELIKLYAARANLKGPKFVDFEDELIFSHNFMYKETADQSKCINDIDKDLKSNVPMDRLLCGDVGFGKTEVAFRGMFKTVMNGYQVAYLCPTTLLSRQQYQNAVERFKDFAINIALLNRFTSVKEVNRVIKGLKEGTIDIVFGTHKLFNKEIEYKNLGLLVVDEEQRFGVTHKEKIKELKNDVNVLTLSATPIPRTLKMAMSGLRDLSIIDTAPVNRYPIQTYVVEENDFLIKDAIYKELARDGQTFILYNKVASIQDEYDRIKKLVPEARIAIAHGQMDKKELEDVVESFVNHEFDVMICTTIIETGIDIPNTNTLIVIDSDNFGLAQLYQIRGRVGRGERIAYAYLMYKPSKVLTDTAVKRLKSIKDFTELGSGYKIAMRDLSIRGAGDLLGSEQAGFVDTVGLELYTQMVNDEIKRLNGEVVEEDEQTNPLIEVSNHIKDEYVSEESLKIEIHKLINSIDSKETLDSVRNEIEDRFGKIDKDIEVYMYQEWFEKLAQRLGIKRIIQNETTIEVELSEDVSNKLEGDKLFLTIYNINPKFRLSYRMKKIYISLPKVNLQEHFIYYEVALLNEIIEMISEK